MLKPSRSSRSTHSQGHAFLLFNPHAGIDFCQRPSCLDAALVRSFARFTCYLNAIA